MSEIKALFEASIRVKQKVLETDAFMVLGTMGSEISCAIQRGNKVLFCGNGGSAADAQHLAAEMLIKLRTEYHREGMAAITLAQDTSTITACGNDFGYDYLYERMVRTLGREGDVLIAITTSGNSNNIVLAMKSAKAMGIKVFGFLGCGGGKAFAVCDEAFVVPSDDTGRIQEVHITAGHALMEYVEDRLIDEGYLHLQG